jgi:hypothetical protein
MSGREREPLAAFFPSIDRSLIRDLDRQLRHGSSPHDNEDEPEAASPPPAPAFTRPSTADVLAAVEQAAASMAQMQARIQELEAKHYDLETTNTQLKAKLGELLHAQQNAESAARTERERANQAEHVAAQHLARVELLEHDLATALNDLNRISQAITGALGGTR